MSLTENQNLRRCCWLFESICTSKISKIWSDCLMHKEWLVMSPKGIFHCKRLLLRIRIFKWTGYGWIVYFWVKMGMKKPLVKYTFIFFLLIILNNFHLHWLNLITHHYKVVSFIFKRIGSRVHKSTCTWLTPMHPKQKLSNCICNSDFLNKIISLEYTIILTITYDKFGEIIRKTK